MMKDKGVGIARGREINRSASSEKSKWRYLMKIVSEHIDKIVAIGKRYGATRLILFGGVVARSENTRDVDLACDGIQGWKLYEFAARLEEELHNPVDVVPLSPPSRFTKYIEKKGKALI